MGSCLLRMLSWLVLVSRHGCLMLSSVRTLNTSWGLTTTLCFSPLGTLLRACPQTDVGSRGLPALSKSSLPPLEDAYPPTFFKSGFISRGPSPDWIDNFLSRLVNFACPEIVSLQSICGASVRPSEDAEEEDGPESGHL